MSTKSNKKKSSEKKSSSSKGGKFCGNCGTKRKGTDKFCTKCGKSLGPRVKGPHVFAEGMK